MVQRPQGFLPHEALDHRIALLAVQRYGMFTRDDALREGASRGLIERRLATKRWERLAPGVYRLAGVPPSWRQTLLTACLSCGPEAVASHRASAGLRGLAGIEPGAIEISVPRGKRQKRRGIVIHEVQSLHPVDVTVVGEIPATTVTRTLIDLGAVVVPKVLEKALDDALRQRLTSVSRLRWRLEELESKGRPGIVAIRALLDARRHGHVTPRSDLETRFAQLRREAGLPEPVLQHQIREKGKLVAVVDFAYPDLRLAIETDGYRWHTGKPRWASDLARRNRLAALGWRVIHVTDTDLEERPDRVTQTIAAALAVSPPR